MRFKGSYLSYLLLFLGSYVGMAAFSAVLSVYLSDIGKSPSQLALILSAGGLFSLGAVPVTGYLCDRSRRPRLICGLELLLLAALALIFPSVRGVWPLFFLTGLINAILNSVMPVTEKLAKDSRFRYGALRVWGTLGYAAGAQLSGAAFQFRPALLFWMVSGCALLAVLGFAGAQDSAAPPDDDKKTTEKPRLSSFLKDPRFLLFAAAIFLLAACSGANMTFAPLVLSALGVPTVTVGTVLSVSTLVEIPLIFFSNRFMDRFSGKTLFLITGLLLAGEFLCFGLSRSPGLTIAVMISVKAVASTLLMMVLLKIVSNLARPSVTTSALAFVNTADSLGIILMQNLGGRIMDAHGVFSVYPVMAALVALGMILSLFLRVGNDEKVFS